MSSQSKTPGGSAGPGRGQAAPAAPMPEPPQPLQTMPAITKAMARVPNQSSPFTDEEVGYAQVDFLAVGPDRYDPVNKPTGMGGSTGAELIES